MDNLRKYNQHEYDLLIRKVNSGNSNENVKLKLKICILRGISENLTPRAQVGTKKLGG